METFLEPGTNISSEVLGRWIVLKQNKRSFECGEKLPRFDIVKLENNEIMEGCYVHNGAWEIYDDGKLEKKQKFLELIHKITDNFRNPD